MEILQSLMKPYWGLACIPCQWSESAISKREPFFDQSIEGAFDTACAWVEHFADRTATAFNHGATLSERSRFSASLYTGSRFSVSVFGGDDTVAWDAAPMDQGTTPSTPSTVHHT